MSLPGLRESISDGPREIPVQCWGIKPDYVFVMSTSQKRNLNVSGGRQDSYDEAKRLIGEYDTFGARFAEHVYLGDIPIAVIKGAVATPEIYYVYADQINRPWSVSDTANQLRWRWNTEPFGSSVASRNPAGLGTFAYNLRFPGQYFDQITRTHYNYYRDYSPDIGRYLESDPIGLRGGINTYAYVGGNPLNWRDPLGLYTEIIAWDPVGVGTSSFGHLSANINGINYSFARGGWDKTFPSAADYAQRQTEFRAGRGVILGLSPEQEAAFEACLQKSSAAYDATSNNCTNPPRKCLEEVGVSNSGFYPDQMVRYLRNYGPGVGNTYYPGPYSSPQDSGAYSR